MYPVGAGHGSGEFPPSEARVKGDIFDRSILVVRDLDVGSGVDGEKIRQRCEGNLQVPPAEPHAGSIRK
eukprot:2798772-Amphidinium_carterae.1